MRANEPANGLREYVRAADLLPNSVDAQVKAGQMLLVARAFEDARARADKALALDRKSVDAQVLRGNALAGLKDFDAAVSEYQDAIALDPSQAAAYSNLATVQLVQGKRVEAEATFKKAVAAAPKSVAGAPRARQFLLGDGQSGRRRGRVEVRAADRRQGRLRQPRAGSLLHGERTGA